MLAALRALAAEADAQRRAYDRTGNPAALDVAVTGWRAALCHPGIEVADTELRTAVRTEAGTALLLLAQRTGRPADLDEAVRRLDEAVAGSPDSAPRWRASVNLAAALRERGGADDLHRAAAEVHHVMEQTARGPVDLYGIAATTLGHVESDRFAVDTDLRHLDAAEVAYQAALAVTDPRSPRRVARRCHLATVGIDRWRFAGDRDALVAAVALLEDTVADAEGSPSWPTAYADLAVALGELFEATGEQRHLNRAIVLVDAVDAVHPSREAENRAVLLARRLELLGDSADRRALAGIPPEYLGAGRAAVLLDRYDHDEALDVLAMAVDAAERAATTARPAYRAPALVTLGAALSARYAATGEVADLERAVGAYRDALSATPEHGPRRSTRLADLADALRERAHRLGRLADLDEAVDLLTDAAARTGADAPGRPHVEAALATALLDRARRSRVRRATDLPTALDRARRAVAHTATGAPDRPGRLGLEAACLHETWRDTGQGALLDRAIVLYRESVAATPEGSPVRFRHRQNLADALADRAVLSGVPEDQAAASVLFHDVVAAAEDRDPWAAVAAARNWGAAASSWQDWPQAAEAFQRGLALLSRLVRAQQVRGHQEGWLRDARQLPAGAAFALVRAGRVAEAVVALDAGRAVLLVGAVQDRPRGGGPR